MDTHNILLSGTTHEQRTTDEPATHHSNHSSSRLALCHDVTLDIMAHCSVPVNTHSTLVLEG